MNSTVSRRQPGSSCAVAILDLRLSDERWFQRGVVVRRRSYSYFVALLLLAAEACGSRHIGQSYEGEWVGQVEGYEFPSGSDRILLTFAEGHGDVVFGAGTPPMPHADVGYPPELDPDRITRPDLVVEGFVFSLSDVEVDLPKLRFRAFRREQWAQWCELQTSYKHSTAIYGCLANWGSSVSGDVCAQVDPATQRKVIVDCGKLALCDAGICRCTRDSCTTDLTGDAIVFDVRVSEARLEGTIRVPDATTRNVYFSRK